MLNNTYVVVWEGVDGSGKTTLMNETSLKLSGLGFNVETYKTPSNTSTGSFAKEYGNKPSTDPLTRMLLFLANTADDSSILKRIVAEKRPEYLFIDRYYICSLVYGFGLLSRRFKQTFDEQRFLNFLNLIEEIGANVFVKPDLTVIVDVDSETRRRRTLQKKSGSDYIYETDEELQTLVQHYYDVLAQKWGGLVVKVFNADSMIDVLSDELVRKILSLRRRV